MKNKRGISGVVVTVLLVLVAIIAIGILWFAIRSTINKGAEESDATSFYSVLEIKKAEISGTNLNVEISRAAGQDVISKLKIVVSNDTDSVITNTSEGIKILETRTYSAESLSNPRKIEIYPVFLVDEKEKIGLKADEYKIESSSAASATQPSSPTTPPVSNPPSTPPTTPVTCPDNRCDAGENCPADSIRCISPPECKTNIGATCTNGCNYISNSSSGSLCTNGFCDGAGNCVQYDLTQGLVAYYKFEENANDETGRNNGTNNGVTFVQGLSGQAGSFNGYGNYITIPTNNLPYGYSSRTMCAWANALSTSSGWHWIVAYGTAAGSNSFFIGRNSANLFGGGYGNDIIYTDFWGVGWNHVCLSYDGTVAKLYGNGVLLVSSNKNWNTIKDVARIGRQTNEGDEYWDGRVDNLRIYNRVLSAQEILYLNNTKQ